LESIANSMHVCYKNNMNIIEAARKIVNPQEVEKRAKQKFLTLVSPHLAQIIAKKGAPYYLYEDRPDKPFGKLVYGIYDSQKQQIDIHYSEATGDNIANMYYNIDESCYRVGIGVSKSTDAPFFVREVGVMDNLNLLQVNPYPPTLSHSLKDTLQSINVLEKFSSLPVFKK
jgi:hypothetical protein